MLAKGLPVLCGYEENCPAPTSPILWPLKTWCSATNFFSFQGPLLKDVGSSCLHHTAVSPRMESSTSFIFHKQNIKIHPSTLSQDYKHYQNVQGRFTHSLSPPHLPLRCHSPRPKLYSIYHALHLSPPAACQPVQTPLPKQPSRHHFKPKTLFPTKNSVADYKNNKILSVQLPWETLGLFIKWEEVMFWWEAVGSKDEAR